MNALDCALINFKEILPIIYLRLIWFQFWFLFYLFLIIIGNLIQIKFRLRAFRLYIVTTSIIFLFLYLQPDIITLMVSLLSCRAILDQQYILANVTYICFERSYYSYTLGLVLPLFLFWIIIFPATIFLVLKRNKT